MRKRLWHIVDQAPPGSPYERASRVFDLTIIALILVNAAAFIVSTVQPVYDAAPWLFDWIEYVSVAVFAVEYLARLALCTEHPDYRPPLRGRLRFAARPMMVIDLLAILPALLPFVGVDLRTLRLLRIMRLARIVKLGRYTTALQTVGRVIRDKREELVVTVALMVIMLIVSATAMYYAENEAQPDAFSSVPESLWWAVATLTTVGYGDVYPITTLGRVIAAIIALLGIGLVAMPTGILAAGFSEALEENKRVARERAAAVVNPDQPESQG